MSASSIFFCQCVSTNSHGRGCAQMSLLTPWNLSASPHNAPVETEVLSSHPVFVDLNGSTDLGAGP